ncbi:MAG: T9SS type A sorting domain-containing protein, partial [Bacteroidales bacterium]|nr:T9SS type A sorting domain-containing protein [Bacteroidales bacterium]
YAVVVTSENGCSDTSSCHAINTLSIQNNPLLDKQIILYPNPTSDKINVQTDLDIAEVYLLDLQGKQLQTSNSKEVDLSKLSSGIYLIKVKLKNNEVWTRKVIKN